MGHGRPVATGAGGPLAVVEAVRELLVDTPDPRYSRGELHMLSEAVEAMAATFCPAAQLSWEVATTPYLQVRLVEGSRSDLVALTPAA